MLRPAHLSFSAALIGSVVLVTAAFGGSRSGAASFSNSRIVYGYPYSARCPGAGIADLVDRWGMYACNCTSYVAWALAANHQRIDWFVRGSMDAWNWPNVARRSSLRVDRRPSRGAVVVWPSLAQPFGHVAYVTGVEPGGTVDIAEYNYPGPNGTETFGFQTRTFTSTAGAVFIHVPTDAQHPSYPPSMPHQ